jgi:site-specific DNA recombinase
VQQKPARNGQFASRNKTAHDYLLSALVSCGLCGLAATGRRAGAGYPYYVCAGKRADGACGGGRCRSRLRPAGQLDELVWEDLCEVIRQPQLIALELERGWGGSWLPEELRGRREGLRKARAGLQQQVERLTEAYLGGVLDLVEYEGRRGEIEAGMEAFAGQERELVQQVSGRRDLHQGREVVQVFVSRRG